MRLRIVATVAFMSVWFLNGWADAIHDAVNRNDFAKVRELIENDKLLVSTRNDKQETALSLAANKGNLEIVSYLVENGSDVNARNLSSNTPLYIAARRGHTEIVKYLIGHDAVVNAYCESGHTPLHAAVSSKKPETVKCLLEHGANANALDDQGEPPLINGCWAGVGIPVFELLLNHGADINFRSQHNMNCINSLTSNGHPDVVRFLIDKGADVNFVEVEDGTNALINAIVLGRENFIDCILPKVNNINLQDKYNKRTALHWATIKGNKSVVEKLLNAGADPNVRDEKNVVAADYTVKYGFVELADLFISKGILRKEALKDMAQSPFSKKMAREEAIVIYNGHSGWTVRTPRHILVFDYYKYGKCPDDAGILNGHILSEDLKGKNVYVFSSHDHNDHFDPSTIFSWETGNDAIKYVFGFDPSKSRIYRRKAYAGPAFSFVPENSQQQVGDLKITTLKSNDTGEGFLIEVDGLTIFHAGDHANLNEEVQEDYQNQINYIAGKSTKVDIAFLPVTGCPVRWSPESVMDGFFYVVDKLNPTVVFPMHGSDKEYIYRNFKLKAQEKGYNNQIECAENNGDVFTYQKK